MSRSALPFDSPITAYEAAARELLAAHRAGDAQALAIIQQCHPRFFDDHVRWLPRPLKPHEIAAAPFDLDDARLAVARAHDYLDWAALKEHVAAVHEPESSTARFETAVEAVVDGDAAALRALLRADPALVHARSSRRTCFDPSVHAATLLHYVAANGVEGFRQRTPANAVEIATILLQGGAEPDALANLYGGECTTVSLLVSSSHPAAAGVQVALIDTLIDHGASPHPAGSGTWTSPLLTALAFGFVDAGEALVRRGARVDRLTAAAGLGRLPLVDTFLPNADGAERHAALAMATLNGHLEVAEKLLAAGEDPSRYNPVGLHAHATPLHHAAGANNLPMARLLLRYGAGLDLEDKLYHSTPVGWAEHGGHGEMADVLRRASQAR